MGRDLPSRVGAVDRLLGHFSRITSGQALIPELDGLRFLAIFAVFAYHANTLACRYRSALPADASEADILPSLRESVLTACLCKGYLGVDIFFAISGFILGLPFARHFRLGTPPVRLGPYFGRRLSRLEVPYLVSLILALAVLFWTRGSVPWANAAASAAYVHGLVFGSHSAINPVAWSLEVEVQFYCLAPLLAFVFKPSRRSVRIAAILALASASIILRTQYRTELEAWHLHDSILEKLHCFATGFIAVEFYLDPGPSIRCLRPWLCDLFGCVGLAWLFWPTRFLEVIEWPLFIPACLAIFLAAHSGLAFASFFRNRWTVTIGGMCYSIYLVHYGAMTLAAQAFGGGLSEVFDSPALNSLLFLLVMAPIALLPAASFFVLVERPCMRRGWPSRLAQAILGNRR